MPNNISDESIQIFTKYPHGNKDLQERLKDIKNSLKNNNNPFLKEGLEFTKTLKLKDKIILDAGCGSGIKSIDIAVKTDAKLVIGVDGSSKAIENAKFFQKELNIKNLKFINGRLEDLELLIKDYTEGKKIDIVVNYQNLHHVHDWKNVLKIFNDILNKDGILITNIADPTAGMSQFMLRNKLCYYLGSTPISRGKIGKFLFGFLEKKKNYANILEDDFYVDRFGAFYHWIFPFMIIKELKKIGFEVVEAFPHFRLNDWLIANKNSKRAKNIYYCINFFPPSKYIFSFLMRFRQWILGEDTRSYYAKKIKKD